MKRRGFIAAVGAVLAAPFTLFAKSKAAGPWRIVEQYDNGMVRLQRDIDSSEVNVNYIVTVVDGLKAQIEVNLTEGGKCSHGAVKLGKGDYLINKLHED